ncbi:MAG TPA: glycosyl hydrolase family 65 protein [Phycisphaerae bacterium]|nr:glycosyl hydrolase family 65 protein [Phycisphaerae bacterium]
MSTSTPQRVGYQEPDAAGAVVDRFRYGRFAPDGREFRITDPRTPRPWVNVIANPRFGLVVTQTGSGFTWIDNSQLAVITRWQQDLVRDRSGKFLYVRDAETGAVWSLAPAPTWAAYDHFECRHGLGYTTFVSECTGIRAEWDLFCHPDEPVELWRVRLHNRSGRPRTLQLCPYLEWCLGVAPDPRREFHKLFIETRYDADMSAVLARNHMWDVPSERYGHWNTDFPYRAAFASTEPVEAAEGDKEAFLGMYNSLAAPEALSAGEWAGRFGRHEDPIAALRSTIRLNPGQSHGIAYVLAVAQNDETLERLVTGARSLPTVDKLLDATKEGWRQRLAALRVDTPDETLNHLATHWLPYQAISGRIWGRCGYYQQSGAYGFRDQLQDSQVWLPIRPADCRSQILVHAAHQLADGAVYHWWHPLTEQGLKTRFSDDLLWLAFVTANYIKETADYDVLKETVPFVDDPAPVPLLEHVERAFQRSFGRTSERGLPYIGSGDWNDGLSAAGLQERGESIWMGHFLAGLLNDWAELFRRIGADDKADPFARRREQLVASINHHGWDGQWYIRATLDDGTVLGSARNEHGRIFLNAQTWAILNDVAPPERAAACMQAVKEHLVTEVGPLLLTPAFARPDPRIGYITRYGPGLRENGGVYTHAACWAIAAACKIGDAETAGRLLDALNPARRDPDRYQAEPYVMPGNIDGPESPHFGRGGWTWYTGSAAWLQRVLLEWVLGVRPDWDGLRIQPCLPPAWPGASLRRRYRGADYQIDIERAEKRAPDGRAVVSLDGEIVPDNLIPPPSEPGKVHKVQVRI